VQNFLKIGSGVPELEDPEKWHFPLKAFIALTTVLRYHADCDNCVLSGLLSEKHFLVRPSDLKANIHIVPFHLSKTAPVKFCNVVW